MYRGNLSLPQQPAFKEILNSTLCLFPTLSVLAGTSGTPRVIKMHDSSKSLGGFVHVQ